MVKAIWEKLEHAAISQRGYEQTGPLLRLEGPITTKDVAGDLLPVFRDLCPHEDPDQLGTQIRDEAKALVDGYWGRQVHSWKDVHLIIEEHADHPASRESASRAVGSGLNYGFAIGLRAFFSFEHSLHYRWCGRAARDE